MGRERWGGGNRKGETVKGQMGGGEEGARGEEISQMFGWGQLGGRDSDGATGRERQGWGNGEG